MAYENIRELLPIEGQKVVMVSQHSEEEWMADSPAYIMLMFESGLTMRIIIDDRQMILVSSSP